MSNFVVAAIKNFLKLRQVEFPPEFDCASYRDRNPDLAQLTDEQLVEHYATNGREQGRLANAMASRNDFAALIPSGCRALEIGPFAHPILRGPNVFYCDVLNQIELQNRAVEIGLNPATVPHIQYVLGPQGLDAIPDNFHALLSSHNLEHQPDLVHHLRQAQRRIEVLGGRLFLIIPDKRYCFDRFIAETTIAQIIDAHENHRTVHTLQSVIEHRALTTHNDSVRHWRERQVQRPVPNIDAIRKAIAEWHASGGSYIDVHAWYFTPDSFAEIIAELRALDLVRLQVERLYPTRFGANEFWAILKT